MKYGDYIWWDGRIVPQQKANIPILTHSLHYGSAVFEGIRFYKTNRGPAAFRLNDHWQRFLRSAEAMGLDVLYRAPALTRAVKELRQRCRLDEGYFRPLAFYTHKMGISPIGCPTSVAIATWPWPKHFAEPMLKVKTSSFVWRDERSIVPGTKVSGYYSGAVLALLEAHRAGYDEALVLDRNGFVAEGPVENVFMVKRNKLYTPKTTNVLPGITRDTVMTLARHLGHHVIEKNILLGDIKNADEVFFTGTAVEVVPVRKIDQVTIGSGTIGPVTQKLKELYQSIVRGEEPRWRKWLTYL